ncbi:MAG: hypothetical protein JWM90_2608 [Thermoleophilia bacterium]|nr:hypothetical protein [Thermoleophilia bacterium]
MDLASLYRAYRDGHASTVRTGLSALLLGAIFTMVVIVLLTPTMDGLIGLPGHELSEPEETTPAPPRAATPYIPKAERRAMRRRAVLAATQEVGVREWPSRANHANRIITYRRAVTGPNENPRVAEPWCADFVSWVWRKAGFEIGFNGQGADYVPELVAWARLTRRWHWARDGYKPKAGDLIVYRSNGDMRGHIGMVAKISPGRVHTIEGNYADQVSRRTVKPWDANVTGFISPV